ncbi:ADP-ribosylglycohydrolase family protein [Neptunicella marina]|uniref:ADP-ribosylglycohydrolase family protein n=1 Tax=Neptunicella marina TaxID=2125989 RepID=A0A8J6IU83_9ALTE|nr:ADP-ribosylglycohydrolase family protein [Neptunicella marina]
MSINKAEYQKKLEGFWLGLNIANWTGLVTEMDKVEPPFYTNKDWGTADQKNIWGNYVPHSRTIDFYLGKASEPWGADDDSDMEYLYLDLLSQSDNPMVSGQQIAQSWIKHIYTNEDAPVSNDTGEKENFLWVSNERALELMHQGIVPPATSEPENNPHFARIDAQLTTELFGLLAPMAPQTALKLAEVPIRTTAKNDAAWIAQFYVVMHSLAVGIDNQQPIQPQLISVAQQARKVLPAGSYAAKMYDFVWRSYLSNPDKQHWELTRDAIYQRYQASSHDGYTYETSFDAGINFAASLVSLFYGEGDYKKTIQIGTLAGWDSDNPTATWGGLLGFILGIEQLEAQFAPHSFSHDYHILRTRRNFADHTPNHAGEDNFSLMADRTLKVIDKVVQQSLNGTVDNQQHSWTFEQGQ